MVNGRYSVEYSGFLPGCGQLTLQDGVIKGSDAGFKWEGSYQADGTHLSGSLLATPEFDVVNVFGDEKPIEFDVVGMITDDSIEIMGTRRGNPGQRLTAILRRIEI
jgi:hypothetical protein